MTKEQLYVKWLMTPDLKSDIEAVIATEIAKAQEAQPKPEYICYKCENKTNNKFAICDKCNVGWNEPKQETLEPSLNPIAEAYERGEKIRHKNWLNGDWIQKYKETKTIDNHGNINSVYPFAFIQQPEKWEIYTEPAEQTEQPSSQVKLDNSFDKDRFEAMFRAVVETHEATMNALKQLDAYYASKEGGNEK